MPSPPMLFLILLSSLSLGWSFEWHTNGGRPPLDRRAIAGLWKLTTCPTFPLKEFTVHPPSQKDKQEEEEELLLMLKEDGSFQQCQKNDEEDIDQAWTRWQKSRQEKQQALDQLQYHFLHGTWDFRDGKLILAADRAEPSKSDDMRRFSKDPAQSITNSNENKKKPSDTLLTGRVVAKYSNKVKGRPLWSEEENTNSDNKVTERASSNSNVDAYLSVPKGSVKVGRFFYPRNHPSFFDQPMYDPKKRGTVSLRQVLGALNTASDEEEETMIEKFRNTDFHNKTFLLTSHPIGFRAAKDKRTDETEQRPDNVRVMQIQFHANNTFSTVAGIGENILRGKFSIMGNLRDQFWMQVSRFGFGRSVSGSVFSEGNSISHEDAKSYWGTIGFQETMSNPLNATRNVTSTEAKQLIEVKGSVLFGWGIEPIPEARFIMRELASDESEEEEDEDDDDDEDMNVLRFVSEKDLPTLGDEDGINLSNSDSFQ